MIKTQDPFRHQLKKVVDLILNIDIICFHVHMSMYVPCIYRYLRVFFHLCSVHFFIPSQCLESVVGPIIDSPTGDTSYSGNCRPVAIASVVTKLCEHVILLELKPLLTTSDN